MDFQRKAEGKSGCTCCSLRLLCGGVSTCSHGCCVDVCVGSRDNRETIHTRSKCCLQPLSLNTCAFCSIISFSVSFTPPVVYARTASSFALLACLSFSVCHQPSLFAFQLAQKNKHKLQQLEAVIVLLWNLIAFSMKGEVVNSELHVTVKSLQ